MNCGNGEPHAAHSFTWTDGSLQVCLGVPTPRWGAAVSDLSAEGLFKRFEPSGRLWSELTDEARGWWIAQAHDLAAPVVHLAAIAKPGDTVLIGFDHQMDDAEFSAMCDRLRPLKDQLGIQIGVIEGASSMVVVRPEVGGES